MKKIVVTGANGFIGRNLIKRLLLDECRIYAVYRKKEHMLFADCRNVVNIECDLNQICNLADLIHEDADVFYHLAWDGSTGEKRGSYSLQLANAGYVCQAAEISKKIGCKRFISTGTIAEKLVPFCIQNHYTSDKMAYAIAKSTAHMLLNTVCSCHGIDYCWVQLSNIFGGDNTNGNLISYTVHSFKKGIVPEYGPCNQPYDFLYIKDAIEGLVKIAFSHHCSNEYFMGSGQPGILKEYILSIAKKYKAQAGIGLREADGLEYQMEWFDSQKLRDEIGFVPYYSFESAVDEMIKEEEQHAVI